MDQQLGANLEELHDDDLVVVARRGDPAAFEQLMRRHNQRLYRAARAILRDDAEAQDAVQDAYLRAFTKLDTYQAGHFGAWLLTIAVNAARTRRRKRKPTIPFEANSERTATPPVVERAPEDHVGRAQLRRVLEEAIDELGDDYREVFMLRELENLATRETAECLGVTEGAVKTRLHRARAQLREILNDKIAGELADTFHFAGARCDAIVAGVLAELKRTGRFLH